MTKQSSDDFLCKHHIIEKLSPPCVKCVQSPASEGGENLCIPSPLGGEGWGEGDNPCLFYFETLNIFMFRGALAGNERSEFAITSIS